MKCPRCDDWVPPPQESCPKCGLNLTVLRSLVELRNVVRRAQSDSDAAASRLRELERQVTSLEPQIVAQLTSPPAPLPPEQPPPEADEAAPAAILRRR